MMAEARQPAAYEAHHDLGTATATDGYVVVDGPGATALTLSPDAAERIAAGLIEAARDARRQELVTK